MAARDFKWDSAKDGCCRMGLQSAPSEHINSEHNQAKMLPPVRSSFCFGFCLSFPTLGMYHFALLCLNEIHVLVGDKNSSFYKTPEP